MNHRRRPTVGSGISSPGFTLIELLVVVFIAAILVALATLSLNVIGDDRDVQREAQRMRSLIQLAGDEAELQGRDFGIEFVRQGYRFVEYDPFFETWGEIVGDEVLRARTLPDDFELDLYIEDRQIALAEQPASTETNVETSGPILEKYAPHGLIMSSGDLSPLIVDVIRRTDDVRARVQIDLSGNVALGDEDLSDER